MRATVGAVRTPRGKLLLALGLLVLLTVPAVLPSASGGTVARGLVAVLAVVVAWAWWWRTKGQGERTRLPQRLQVHARTGLSPRCALALVEADGQRFLVAYGDGFADINPMPGETP